MKTIRKGFALLFKITLLALLVAMLTPILYFAWQMGKPMSQPEFKGLTYYQFAEWRKISCKEYNARLQKEMLYCEPWRYVALDFYGTIVPSIFLVIERPEMFEYVTIYNILPTTWSMFQSLTWHMNNSEVGCLKYFGRVPTPEEFETLKMEHQLSVVQ